MMNETRYRILQWGKTGAYQGAKWAFILACGYMLVTTLLMAFVGFLGFIANVASDGNPTDAFVGLIGGFVFLVMIWCIGFGIGVLPAVGVGIVMGWVVGTVVALPSVYATPVLRRVAGVSAVLALVYGVGTFLLKQYGMTIEEFIEGGSFYYFIGVPSLFCLGTMVWLSDRLPRLATTPPLVETVAVERPVQPPLWLE